MFNLITFNKLDVTLKLMFRWQCVSVSLSWYSLPHFIYMEDHAWSNLKAWCYSKGKNKNTIQRIVHWTLRRAICFGHDICHCRKPVVASCWLECCRCYWPFINLTWPVYAHCAPSHFLDRRLVIESSSTLIPKVRIRKSFGNLIFKATVVLPRRVSYKIYQSSEFSQHGVDSVTSVTKKTMLQQESED